MKISLRTVPILPGVTMAKEEPAEVLSIEGREVRITNPDKPYFSRDVKLSKL